MTFLPVLALLMLHVTNYMMHVTCLKCTSYVIYCMLEMPCILFWFHPNLSHMLHVTCYMSQVICLMLHIICHILHIRNALHSVLISSKYISHVNLAGHRWIRYNLWHVTCEMCDMFECTHYGILNIIRFWPGQLNSQLFFNFGIK